MKIKSKKNLRSVTEKVSILSTKVLKRAYLERPTAKSTFYDLSKLKQT